MGNGREKKEEGTARTPFKYFRGRKRGRKRKEKPPQLLIVSEGRREPLRKSNKREKEKKGGKKKKIRTRGTADLIGARRGGEKDIVFSLRVSSEGGKGREGQAKQTEEGEKRGGILKIEVWCGKKGGKEKEKKG